MEAIVPRLDAGIFRTLLDFTKACGCTDFTVRNSGAADAFSISALSSVVQSALLPFLAKRQCGSPAYILTAVLNAETVCTLEYILSAGFEHPLSLNFGKILQITIPADSARLSLSDFQAEALFR